FLIINLAIAQTGRGRSLERPAGQRHVRLSDVQRFRRRNRSFGGLDIRKQFLVSHQMPDRLPLALIDGDDSQQAKPALELKDQVIAGRKLVIHKSENISIERGRPKRLYVAEWAF